LKLTNHVEFLGEVRDVPALLHRASLFVLPSLTEGVPLTVLEAMACGLPVVATRVGGTPEALADGITGLLVPPGDPRQLADALLRIHNDASMAQRMGLAGRARVETLFDVRTMVASYESLYEEVLAEVAQHKTKRAA
ncbi:MAG TPA: glycosyltransferase, partial [Tepidisphaeraceae bacterium]|nr:glycosyltransferase [Tepidisphaeraceae bacterium]